MIEVKENIAVFSPMTVEEYIQFELKSDGRHEFNNGQLADMSGEKQLIIR